MNFMFPYNLIERGSKIILYGEGKVGKEFYLQLHYNKYCTVEAWVDKAFEIFDVKSPFDKVDNILNYDFDYIVVALADKNQADDVREYLEGKGIDKHKIIWSRFYPISEDIFPDNRELYLNNWEFYLQIIDDYLKTTQWFGGSCWYQGSPELGIKGARKNAERIAKYNVDKFLDKKSEVLDIGCNCGFFDIELARWVKSVKGIDVERKYIELANKVSSFRNVENVSFIEGDFMDIQESFDAVFSLGVHNYIFESGISRENYIRKLKELTRDNGYIFFESHGLISDGNQFVELCNLFEIYGMKSVYTVHSLEDGNRRMVVFKR